MLSQASGSATVARFIGTDIFQVGRHYGQQFLGEAFRRRLLLVVSRRAEAGGDVRFAQMVCIRQRTALKSPQVA